MATLVRGYAFGKRTGSEMNCVLTYPGAANGNFGGWTDVSQQVNSELSSLPIGVFFGEITQAQGTALLADSNFLVIGWQNVDSVTGVTSGGNWTQVLNTTMVNALKTWFSTNWPGVPAGLLSRMDTLVGMTRVQAALVARDFIKSRAAAGV